VSLGCVEPFDFDFEWGSIAQKPGRLYLHVLKWAAAGIQFGRQPDYGRDFDL